MLGNHRMMIALVTTLSACSESLPSIDLSGARGIGIRQDLEACDDGNSLSTDSCTVNCTIARCGDSFVQAGEACDDGNINDRTRTNSQNWLHAAMGSGGRISDSTMSSAMSAAMTETKMRMMRAHLAVLLLAAAMVCSKPMKLAMTGTAAN